MRLLQPVQPASSVDPAENVYSNCLRAIVLAHARIMKMLSRTTCSRHVRRMLCGSLCRFAGIHYHPNKESPHEAFN